jgi:hypothetical protein
MLGPRSSVVNIICIHQGVGTVTVDFALALAKTVPA